MNTYANTSDVAVCDDVTCIDEISWWPGEVCIGSNVIMTGAGVQKGTYDNQTVIIVDVGTYCYANGSYNYSRVYTCDDGTLLLEIDHYSDQFSILEDITNKQPLANCNLTEEICGNYIDDDGDGFIDKLDTDCIESCTNNFVCQEQLPWLGTVCIDTSPTPDPDPGIPNPNDYVYFARYQNQVDVIVVNTILGFCETIDSPPNQVYTCGGDYLFSYGYGGGGGVFYDDTLGQYITNLSPVPTDCVEELSWWPGDDDYIDNPNPDHIDTCANNIICQEQLLWLDNVCPFPYPNPNIPNQSDYVYFASYKNQADVIVVNHDGFCGSIDAPNEVYTCAGDYLFAYGYGEGDFPDDTLGQFITNLSVIPIDCGDWSACDNITCIDEIPWWPGEICTSSNAVMTGVGVEKGIYDNQTVIIVNANTYCNITVNAIDASSQVYSCEDGTFLFEFDHFGGNTPGYSEEDITNRQPLANCNLMDEICGNNIDDDGDGFLDYLDPDCIESCADNIICQVQLPWLADVCPNGSPYPNPNVPNQSDYVYFASYQGQADVIVVNFDQFCGTIDAPSKVYTCGGDYLFSYGYGEGDFPEDTLGQYLTNLTVVPTACGDEAACGNITCIDDISWWPGDVCTGSNGVMTGVGIEKGTYNNQTVIIVNAGAYCNVNVNNYASAQVYTCDNGTFLFEFSTDPFITINPNYEGDITNRQSLANCNLTDEICGNNIDDDGDGFIDDLDTDCIESCANNIVCQEQLSWLADVCPNGSPYPNPNVPNQSDYVYFASYQNQVDVIVISFDQFCGTIDAPNQVYTCGGDYLFAYGYGEGNFIDTLGQYISNLTVVPTDCGEAECNLYPSLSFSNPTFAVDDSRYIIINVQETGGFQTEGEIELFIPNSAGFEYIFEDDITTCDVFGVQTVHNTEWEIDQSVTMGLLLKTTASINGNSKNKLGIQVKAVSSGSKGSFTISLTPGSGGEQNSSDNINVLTQSIQN